METEEAKKCSFEKAMADIIINISIAVDEIDKLLELLKKEVFKK